MPMEEIEHGTVTCLAERTSIEVKVRHVWMDSGPDHVANLNVEGKDFTCRLQLDAVRLGALVSKLQGALADMAEGPPRETRKRKLGE